MAITTHAPALLRGDEEQLYRTHARKLRSVVRMKVNTTEDVVDDACAFAWLQLVRCQPRRETVFGWLKRVATREAVRLHRIQRAFASSELEVLEHPVLRDHRTEPATLDEIIDALDVLGSLQDRQRLALGLHALGFHYCEIGELTGDTARTVARQIFKARRAIRGC